MQAMTGDRTDEKIDENVVVNQVKCELHKGVQDALINYADKDSGKGEVDWLKGWGAKVTFTLTVDEKGGVSPGLTFVSPYEISSQTVSLGLGGSLSSEATRKETIGYTFAFSDLLKGTPIKECSNENGTVIHSDLKISEFIDSKAFLARVPGSVSANSDKAPYSTFSDQITFVVVYSGNLTPSWKLVRLSANSGGNFLTASHSKTQDVLITLSEIEAGNKLTAEAQAEHQAALIGQAVADALRNQQH
jgi:hypothetical protein